MDACVCGGYVNINKGGSEGALGCIYVCNISLGIIEKGIHNFSNLCLTFKLVFDGSFQVYFFQELKNKIEKMSSCHHNSSKLIRSIPDIIWVNRKKLNLYRGEFFV